MPARPISLAFAFRVELPAPPMRVVYEGFADALERCVPLRKALAALPSAIDAKRGRR